MLQEKIWKQKYQLERNCVKADFEDFLLNGDMFMYLDFVLAQEICNHGVNCDRQSLLQDITNFRLENGDVLATCNHFEQLYGLEKNSLRETFEVILGIRDTVNRKPIQYEDGKKPVYYYLQRVDISSPYKLLYSDSAQFLIDLAERGYEVNILTYTIPENWRFQSSKVNNSGIMDLKFTDKDGKERYVVNNIVMCSNSKGELGLEYRNEDCFFIDDNPKEIRTLLNAGVSIDRMIRMRREGGTYTLKDMEEYIGREEYANLSDIDIDKTFGSSKKKSENLEQKEVVKHA